MIDRKKFKELLECTIIPEKLDIEEKSKLLLSLERYVYSILPSRLFRYRECNELQFDAFYNDMIYAPDASKLNDPYDSLLKFDKGYILKTVKSGASVETVNYLRDYIHTHGDLPDALKSFYSEELAHRVLESIANMSDSDLKKRAEIFSLEQNDLFASVESIFSAAVRYMKQQTHVACFSETVKSVTMWSHYAKSHSGFALEYNFRNSFTDCERCVDRVSCPNRVLTNIYPVIYSDRRYDVTSFVEYYLGMSMGLTPTQGDMLATRKAALHKSSQWKYEQEWRLFFNEQSAERVTCLRTRVSPAAIYYGCNISNIHKKFLSDIAKEKGLKEYQMYIDVESPHYSMKVREV